MTLGGVVPDWLLSITAAATLFVLMVDLGIAIVPLEFRWVMQRRALLARALFSVLIAVPALVWMVARAFGVPRMAEIGMLLMAIAPALAKLGSILLTLLLVLALVDVYQTVIDAGLRVGAAIVVATLLALATGHAFGGPESTKRTSTAISSAVRNAGLALLVATLNKAAPAIVATILAYLVLSAFTVIPYAI